MTKPLYIVGAGGFGRELLSFLKGSELWTPAGLLDDKVSPQTMVGGVPVIGGIDVISQLPKPLHLVLAIGDPIVKQTIIQRLSNYSGVHFPVLIHPRSILQDIDTIKVGEGTIITAGCILTNDIQIGRHVLLNLNCTVGHNTVIGNYSSIMPGVNLAGQVLIGESVLIGSGANVINRICVGDRCRIGAGAVVIRDIPADALAVGVPAKTR